MFGDIIGGTPPPRAPRFSQFDKVPVEGLVAGLDLTHCPTVAGIGFDHSASCM